MQQNANETRLGRARARDFSAIVFPPRGRGAAATAARKERHNYSSIPARRMVRLWNFESNWVMFLVIHVCVCVFLYLHNLY